MGASISGLDLDYGYRVGYRRAGQLSIRWVPVGMPRILRGLERCVFFLYGHNPQTGNLSGPGATGFFVSRASRTLAGLFHIYAVSNRHAVVNYPCIRVNWGETGTRIIECDPTEWVWSDTDDLAALDVTDMILADDGRSVWGGELSSNNQWSFVTKDLASHHIVGIGDQTVMLGLFTDHARGARNVPVGRFGNLAALPDDTMPVSLGSRDDLARPAFLNDMRSRSGFSGSPVWIFKTPYDDMNEIGIGGVMQVARRPSAFLKLLGVHRGQFREETTIGLLEGSRALQSGDNIDIASSMTVVIPAWEIDMLLDKNAFEHQRLTRDLRDDRVKEAQGFYETSKSLE